MEHELETIDSTNDDQENTNSQNSESEDTGDTEDNEGEKPEYTEREKQYYARIKKLEKELKEAQKLSSGKEEGQKESQISTELSTLDIIALSKANIEDEDLDEVLEYANFKKIPVREALKSPILKSILAEKAEVRKSAQAVNTGATRRASGQVSDERLLADAQKGILPENEADIARLARLRFQNK